MTGHECTRECWEHILRYGTRAHEECTSAAAREAAEGAEIELPDGGWVNTEKGWALDPSQQERVRRLHDATMARIDEKQKHYPVCALCKQRTFTLDDTDLCSKVTADHKEWRDEARQPVSFR